jgi:hypothetical protein
MGETDMIGVALIVALFALLAFDLGANDGAWSASLTTFANDVLSEIKHLGSR